MVPEFDGLTSFRKSGMQRLRDAEHMLNPPTIDTQEQGASARHMRGAMYLCGYGVECLLKAYLITQHPPSQRLSEVLGELRKTDPNVRDICGEAGHDLRYLLVLTKLEGQMNKEREGQMNRYAKWRSSWRYDPKPAREDDAKEMVQAARALVNWIISLI